MFDFGWQEFMMVAFVLVLVVGLALEAVVVRLIEEDLSVPGWLLEVVRATEEEPLDIRESEDGA